MSLFRFKYIPDVVRNCLWGELMQCNDLPIDIV